MSVSFKAGQLPRKIASGLFFQMILLECMPVLGMKVTLPYGATVKAAKVRREVSLLSLTTKVQCPRELRNNPKLTIWHESFLQNMGASWSAPASTSFGLEWS